MTKRPPFESLAQAVEAYYEELRRFVAQRTGSPALAEDVVQETWIRASRAGVAMPDNPRAYVYRMASNLAVDHLRRDRTRTSRISDEALSPALVAPEPAPDEIAASREELAILQAAVSELPDRCRAVFLLYRGRGYSMRQVAETLGISEKTVEKHIVRAMLHCRQRLRAAGRDI